MRVEKWLMVLSFVPEPSRRNIQHLNDYPVFNVFFFDFRTLAVSWSTRSTSAQRAAHCDSSDSLRKRNFKSARTPLRTSKSARTVIPTNFYADELIRGEPQIENWKMNYDARVWVRPRTTTRVELIRGFTGILPASTKIWSLLPAGIFRWFYVFAGWRSFCLSKTDPKRRNALVSILGVAELSDGRSSSRLKVRPSTRARSHGARVSDRETIRDDHESHVHACQITCKWRRMPLGTSGLLSVACARDLARWRVTPGLRTASIAGSSEMRERPSVCRSRKRILKTLRSRVLSTSIRLNVTGRGKVHRG